MPAIWTCPRGHQWENTAPPGSPPPPICPVCGSIQVGPLIKPEKFPGSGPDAMAETRGRDEKRDILPFGLAESPVRQPPPTKKSPLSGRPAPVTGNLDDTLMPMRIRPPADEQLDETIMRPITPAPTDSAAPAPGTPPAAKGCWATASALILAGAALAATALAAVP